MIQVTIWNEYIHERENEEINKVYPDGIHTCIGEALQDEFEVKYATLDMPEHGLTKEVLQNTDVLLWWGHICHEKVDDTVVARVRTRVLEGMGLICLHSAHHSKIMKALLGTTCNLRWRHGDRERIWCIAPNHPIAKGIPEYFELEQEEMYGEYFDIPKPDEVVFTGWFAGGEVFRSGVVFERGRGKLFYFQPGHEEYPIYQNPYIRTILVNAVNYVYREDNATSYECSHEQCSPEDKRIGGVCKND